MDDGSVLDRSGKVSVLIRELGKRPISRRHLVDGSDGEVGATGESQQSVDKAIQEISAKQRAIVKAIGLRSNHKHRDVGENHGMRPFQAAGLQPVRPDKQS